MTPKQERTFCAAMTKTLWAYENLIQNPGKYRRHFREEYILPSSVCSAVPINPLDPTDCSQCPLNSCFEVINSAGKFLIALRIKNEAELRRAARARYKWLIKKIESAGYCYE